jgi:hypothetical protein
MPYIKQIYSAAGNVESAAGRRFLLSHPPPFPAVSIKCAATATNHTATTTAAKPPFLRSSVSPC